MQAGQVAAQSLTRFCIDDGSEIGAERFETREGKFFLYVPGSPSPLEYPASRVKGINPKEGCQAAKSNGSGAQEGQGKPATKCPDGSAVPASGVCEERKQSAAGSVPKFGIHGSNTIGERLMPMLIDAFSQKAYGQRSAPVFGEPAEQVITLGPPSSPKAVIELHAHGSATFSPAMLSRRALIGMSSRRIDERETIDLAKAFNVDMRVPGNEHVLALDGLSMIVNPANPVPSLSLQQIAQIYAGEITSWSQVGGPSRPIVTYRRDDKSGSFSTFNALVLRPFGLSVAGSAKSIESSEIISASVANDPDSIGFVSFPYINKNKVLGITSSCGILSFPTHYTVKTEEYYLSSRLYLYTLGQPAERVASDLLDFAMSDDAQSVVTQAGFIDQSIEFQDEEEQNRWVDNLVANPTQALGPDKDVPARAVSAFGGLMPSLRRMAIVFRFASGENVLDTRALQDVKRLARHLTSPAVAGKPFFIAGFADSNGSWRANLDLAAKRAATVAIELQQNGVLVPPNSLLSLSYMSPVACNDTEEGRAKNRRVEIWVTR